MKYTLENSVQKYVFYYAFSSVNFPLQKNEDGGSTSEHSKLTSFHVDV